MTEAKIAKKGTSEFTEAQKQYLTLFFSAKADEYLKRGVWTTGEKAGQFLGCTTQKILDAKLAMPFGCPLLFIQPCIDMKDPKAKVEGVIWFCGIDGSICVCCRTDFTKPEEEYPNYCKKNTEPDDCERHQGDCDGCPSNYNCHPELEEPEDWEVEEWEGDF